MKFLIQTINNEIIHDFSRELIESIKFNNWFYNTLEYEYKTTSKALKPDIDTCPCGSVEFVLECLKLRDIDIKPMNVPESLFKYAGRKIKNGTFNDLPYYDFIKSNEKIKGITGFIDSFSLSNFKYNEFVQLSEEIEILSEYRCFVFQNELVGIKHYTGDFKIFPNISTIENMIKDFTNSPISYTIDVGIKDNGETIVIECHDFFSCGLYGFNDYKLLPLMFYRWYKEKINDIW